MKFTDERDDDLNLLPIARHSGIDDFEMPTIPLIFYFIYSCSVALVEGVILLLISRS